MESTLPSTAAAHDDRGAFVVIGASPYVAYAVHGTPAHLTRATHNPDGSITLRPVGAPFARLDLAVDAGRWRAEREACAATAEYECARCGTPVKLIGGARGSGGYPPTPGGAGHRPPPPDATPQGERPPPERQQRVAGR